MRKYIMALDPVSYTHLAEKRARETGMTYGEDDNLIAQPPESNIPDEYNPVSYTHPDVYKRQIMLCFAAECCRIWCGGYKIQHAPISSASRIS